jgi:hypothetical protein
LFSARQQAEEHVALYRRAWLRTKHQTRRHLQET